MGSGRSVVLAALALSGCAALVLEVAWTRWLGLHLGNFQTATATVVAVFMLGLGLGSWFAGRIAGRLSGATAFRGYAVAEALVAACALVSPFLLGPGSAPAALIARAGESAALRAALCGLLLLPPTMAMGATLPLLVRALGTSDPGLVGRLYAVNTLGAAAGPLVGVHLFAPGLGWSGAVFGSALLGVAAALIGWRTAVRMDRTGPAPGVAATSPVAGVPSSGDGRPALAGVLACGSGFLALVLQVCLTRLLVLTVTGSSVYGLAAILAATLLGLGIGGAWFAIRPASSPSRALTGFVIAQCVVWAAAVATIFADRVPGVLAPTWEGERSFAFRAALDLGVACLLAGPAAVASGYGLPSLVSAGGDRSAAAVGRIFALNTLGAVIGSLAAGWVLLPNLGLHACFMLAAGLAAVLGGAAFAIRGPGFDRRVWWAVPAVVLPVLVVPEPGRMEMNLGLWNRPALAGAASRQAAARGSIIFQRDSFTGRIAVWREYTTGLLSFLVNGKADGSTGRSDMVTQVGSVHLAALAHPAPKRCLVIGLGSGVSAGSLVRHPAVQSVEVVEIEPAQAEVARIFGEANGEVLSNPKVRLVLDDARRFVATSSDSWDLVASEPSNLFVSGMVNLYTAEFYRSVRARLNPGGVFMQWVHYYQMDSASVRGAIATFLSVFPQASWWANEFGDGFLLGADGPAVLDPAAWERRLAEPALAADLRRIGFDRPLDLLGLFIWGPEDLARFAGNARICTDDDPWLERASARARWRPDAGVAAYAGMVLGGDVLPMAVARDSVALRLRLGRIFLDRRSLARAVAEFRRALFQDPRSAQAAAGLREAEAVAAELRRRFR